MPPSLPAHNAIASLIETCQRDIEAVLARRIGLTQALIGQPLKPGHFTTEREWMECERGYMEGRELITKEATLAMDSVKVKIPFRPRFRIPMINDVKTMTCRTRKMGKVGNTFEAFGALFMITHVFRARLGFIIADCFIQEGCESVQDLMDGWKSIHPQKGVDDNETVFAHCFRRII